MEEMSRCIHCTRCVRFGQEVAGVMELGMSHRGEHAEIETFIGQSRRFRTFRQHDRYLPGRCIDQQAIPLQRTDLELSRRKSVSPHDSTGANLIVQVKNNQVMRVVPLENEAVNECWIADRDRFSYEALNGADRLTSPMIKQGGEWKTVDWQTALEYVANGMKQIKANHGANTVGALVSPHSTLEELFLAKRLMNSFGSDSVDFRLRHAEFARPNGVPYLGTSISALSTLQRVLVVGANLRKDHPLFAQRIRQACKAGARVHAIADSAQDWAMPLTSMQVIESAVWAQALADIATAVGEQAGVQAPVSGTATDAARAVAASLLVVSARPFCWVTLSLTMPESSSLATIANWIGAQTGATVGFLTEAANTVGAYAVGAVPAADGLSAGRDADRCTRRQRSC